MKILLINKYYYIKGGPERCLFNTEELFHAKGHEVAVFSMRHPLNITSAWDKYFVSNIDFDKAQGINQKIKLFFNTIYSKEAERNIGRLIEKFKPDIAHIHNFNHQLTPSILFPLAKKKIPIVVTLHDYKLICPSYRLLSKGTTCERCKGGNFYNALKEKCHQGSFTKSLLAMLESYIHHKVLKSYGWISNYISPSRFLIEKSREMGLRGKFEHVPNFIDVKNFSPSYNKDSMTIAYFGRIEKHKGIETLFKAVEGLPITLELIGEGDLLDNLRAAVTGSTVDNVDLLGYLGNNDLFDKIRKALFVVLPSEWYENNPFTILESFALGKPVIGSMIGGIPELVKDGVTGLTFEPGNVSDLRSKIEYMLANRDKVVEMGKSARKLVEDEFNAEKHYERLIDIYNNALFLNGEKI